MTPTNTSVVPQLVVEGTLQYDGPHGEPHFFLPVTINGHAAILGLDLGTIAGVGLADDGAARLGITQIALFSGQLDSLTLGETVEHHVQLWPLGINWSIPLPAGLPPFVGLLGTKVLSHYDILFDAPSHRVRLYRLPPNVRVRQNGPPPWLPAGFTAADCMTMPLFQDSSEHWVGLTLRVNGHRITSFFDSGAPATTMNMSAARLIGLTQHSPNVERIPDSLAREYKFGGGRDRYIVRDLTLHLGMHRLPQVPILIKTNIPVQDSDAPLVALGLDVIQGRMFFVSYHARQVCLSHS